jgi:hypothetical protein
MLIAYLDDREILMDAVTFAEAPDLRHCVLQTVLHAIAGWPHRTLSNPSVITSLAPRFDLAGVKM